MDSIWCESFNQLKQFNKQQLALYLQENNYNYSDSYIRKNLYNATKNGSLIKMGRNYYKLCDDNIYNYKPSYSKQAVKIKNVIFQKYTELDFSIFELNQLNEFINHQIAHNVIFINVEKEIIDFVFQKLKELYPGKVLLQPDEKIFQTYWTENMIVINKLVTQRPVFKENKWEIRIETFIVDSLADKLIYNSLEENEYANLLEYAFNNYAIDEKSLFRYAKRRNQYFKLKEIINNKTNIILREES